MVVITVMTVECRVRSEGVVGVGESNVLNMKSIRIINFDRWVGWIKTIGGL